MKPPPLSSLKPAPQPPLGSISISQITVREPPLPRCEYENSTRGRNSPPLFLLLHSAPSPTNTRTRTLWPCPFSCSTYRVSERTTGASHIGECGCRVQQQQQDNNKTSCVLQSSLLLLYSPRTPNNRTWTLGASGGCWKYGFLCKGRTGRRATRNICSKQIEFAPVGFVTHLPDHLRPSTGVPNNSAVAPEARLQPSPSSFFLEKFRSSFGGGSSGRSTNPEQCNHQPPPVENFLDGGAPRRR